MSDQQNQERKEPTNVYMLDALQRVETMNQEQLVTHIAELLRYNHDLEQSSPVPEAIGSCSTYFVGPGGAEVLITSRGISLEAAWKQLAIFANERSKEGVLPLIKNNNRVAQSDSHPVVTSDPKQSQQPAQQQRPVYQNVDGTSMFKAEWMTYAITERGAQYKVWGKPFDQFGVIVWPEVLQASGINMDIMKPGEKDFQVNGMTAYYVVNDNNKPKKVVKLVK